MAFEHYIISQTTGDNDSASQVLLQNTIGYDNAITFGSFFTYLYPTYTIEGATFDYYGRDYNSISYDITNGKSYTLFFSGESTSSILNYTGSSLISHDLYKIPYSQYQFSNSFQTIVDAETVQNSAGFNLDDYIQTPLFSVSESVSALTISNSAYTYSFPTLYKDVGNYTKNVFNDKDQFFLDTVIYFEESNDLTLGDAYYFDTVNFVPVRKFLEPSATTFYNSNKGNFTITGDTPYSGAQVSGAFFTYFVPPKKPNLYVSGGRSLIAVEGVQSNLSPVFNFANVDDGDLYQLQVNYDSADTPFSGSDIFTYTINKQAGDAEFVRVFSTPLRANDEFIYRIGNTKEIINIFGNRQTITTWSDSINASVVATGNFRFSGHTWRNFIGTTYDGFYYISGMTVGANTLSPQTFNFTTTLNGTMPSGTISASTNGVDTVTVEYNGNVYTSDWRNAVYSADSWSSLSAYVENGSPSTAVTDSSFSFTTTSRGIEGVSLNLYQIYNNTQLDLGIDLRSSEVSLVSQTNDYQGYSTTGVIINRVSGTNGFFDFGNINGGYFRLIATPPSPQYAAYEPIDTYITLNSDLNLDLIFFILWGNQSFGFDDLSNETFL